MEYQSGVYSPVPFNSKVFAIYHNNLATLLSFRGDRQNWPYFQTHIAKLTAQARYASTMFGSWLV
jgi:hypothetical protein